MKHSYLLLLFLVSGIALPNLNAQEWDHFGSLINFFDNDDDDYFNTELGGLQDEFSFGDVGLSGSVDSLFFLLDNNTLGQADSSQNVWNSGGTFLGSMIDTNDLTQDDSLSFTNQYSDLNDAWNSDIDSLNTVMGSYQGELDGIDLNAIHQGEVRSDAFKGQTSHSMITVDNRVDDFFKEHTDQDPDDLEDLLKTSIFSGLFDIEMAFGQEWNDVQFWGDEYSVRANLIRVASVPTFRNIIETRWSLESSFFNGNTDTRGETNAALSENLNPLMYNANFSFLFLPSVGTVSRGRAEFRIYTSIGLDVGTYAPSHVDSQFPERIGQTTGVGPELGAGFAVNFENVSLYGYGTIAHGEIRHSDIWPDYRYNSKTLNTGIRIGDFLNIRYTLGNSEWALEDRKTASFSRFTVGILLDSLRRN